MNKADNPFYHNYLFSEEDVERAIIKKWQYPLLWLLPTYVQRADGYAFHFKVFQGKYYLMKVEDPKEWQT